MTPLISIIITTHNRPDFLYRCLRAVQNQTLKEFECIIVADHDENAGEVVKQFNDTRFTFHNNTTIKQTNVGATGKNIGVGLAKTNIICYCNDDDVLLPNHAEVCYEGIRGHELFISCFFEMDYGNCDEYEILKSPLYNHKGRIGFKDNIAICHKKDLWRKAGKWQPMEKVGYNEDGYFIPKLYYHAESKINLGNMKCTAIYNLHHNSMKSDDYAGSYESKFENRTGIYVYPELIDILCER